MDERRILEIAAAGVARHGHVAYVDFDELRPVNQTGNKFLFFVRRCLLEAGYEIHMRRDSAEWGICGYPADSTHFHKPRQ